jgi:hypothetical protein
MSAIGRGRIMELQKLLREIHWLEWQLRAFEDKYSIRSADFYQAMESGELTEFDDVDDPHFVDFLEWHGLYNIWLKRDEVYRELLNRQSIVEQLRRMLVAA